MAGEDNRDHEVFIDADAGFANEKNSYETIILNQINACVRILSREMTGGQIVHREGTGGIEKYIEDVREMVINHVDALKMLMSVYIDGNNKKIIDKIQSEIEERKKTIGETKVVVPGKGIVKLDTIKGVHVDSPIWKEFIHYKALRYREMFEVLVNCYNKHKSDIRDLEEE